jgi:hypothetical protein
MLFNGTFGAIKLMRRTLENKKGFIISDKPLLVWELLGSNQ